MNDNNDKQQQPTTSYVGRALSEEERKGLYGAPQRPAANSANVAPLFGIPETASLSIEEQLAMLNKTPMPKAGESSVVDLKKKDI